MTDRKAKAKALKCVRRMCDDIVHEDGLTGTKGSTMTLIVDTPEGIEQALAHGYAATVEGPGKLIVWKVGRVYRCRYYRFYRVRRLRTNRLDQALAWAARQHD